MNPNEDIPTITAGDSGQFTPPCSFGIEMITLPWFLACSAVAA
jgi:hypothetical protein